MKQSDIVDFLRANSDKTYNEFNSRLVRTSAPTLGVRVPVMRKFAAQIAKDCSAEFLRSSEPVYFEEFSLRGFVIGNLRGDTGEILREVERFIPLIDNWATCDTFCSSLKHIVKKEPQAIWAMIERNIKSDKEFEIRWAIIMMLSHFLTDYYIDRVLYYMQTTRNSAYYVEMGIAWTLATALAKHRDKTLAVLQSGALSDEVLKKTVRKSCESFRIAASDKEYLKTLLPHRK